MELSAIHDSQYGAAGRTAATADDAKTLGFTSVQVHYEPRTGMHTVTGTPPAVPDNASAAGGAR